uniref:Uncharacterized protein n=1 Tax=viral metagenome TaxID=1070528 RepID=A0A6M3LTU9_9ZZZZ
MFPIFDIIMGIGGLIVPPVFDFIKKKFVKSENDTPERTIGTLATTKPEVLPDYVRAVAELNNSNVAFFNRDVIGNPSQWVVDIRAAIRPIGVILAFITLGYLVYMSLTSTFNFQVDVTVVDEILTGVRGTCELMITSWFGTRISIKG